MRQAALPFARRFLIPTDGGPASAAAARLGLRLARAMGASVLAVSVVDPQVARGYAAADLLRYDVRAAAEAQARGAVEAVARQARTMGVRCRTVVRHGPVPATLLAEARAYRAGLLVMGTRGHTGLKRLVMGSVAAAVAAKAPCPALLVPPAARARRGRKRS